MASDELQPFFALDPVEVEIGFGSPRRQSRLTVAFRGLLVLPHVVVLVLLSLLVIPLAVVGWFAALILGRLPRWIAVYQMSVIAYSIRVNAYGFMLVNEFPPFSLSHGDYPLRLELGASRLSRLKVLFRWLLAIPAAIVSAVASNGLLVFSPILWIVTLVLGRMPQPLFSVAAAVVRYQARYTAYGVLVTDAYPRRLFGDPDFEWAEEGFRLSLSGVGRWIMGLVVVLGVAVLIANLYLRYESRPKPNPAIGYAEQRLGNAEVNAVTGAGCNLRCEKAHERVLGEAYFRFASDISRIPFPVSELRRIVVIVLDGRRVGHLMFAASKAKDGGRTLGIDPADPADSPVPAAYDAEVASVLGPVP